MTDNDNLSDLVPSTLSNQPEEQPECRYSLHTQQVLKNPQVSFVNIHLDPLQPWHVLTIAKEFNSLRDDNHSAYVNLTLAEFGLNVHNLYNLMIKLKEVVNCEFCYQLTSIQIFIIIFFLCVLMFPPNSEI